MAKDPAFLFYPSDFEMGTLGWTYDQKGKYITLLNLQHSKGGYLTERDIKRVLHFDNEDDLEILSKFKLEDGMYFNRRLLDELNKRKEHSNKQRENAYKRWNKDTNAMRTQCDGITNAMPLENENRNININKVFKDFKEEKEDSVKEEKETIDYNAILNYWNKNSKLKEIEKLTDKRKSNINARYKEYGIDKIFLMIDNASKSSFLRGDNSKNWFANFDWCFLPNNFIKVLEGNYVKQNQKEDIFNGKEIGLVL